MDKKYLQRLGVLDYAPKTRRRTRLRRNGHDGITWRITDEEIENPPEHVRNMADEIQAEIDREIIDALISVTDEEIATITNRANNIEDEIIDDSIPAPEPNEALREAYEDARRRGFLNRDTNDPSWRVRQDCEARRNWQDMTGEPCDTGCNRFPGHEYLEGCMHDREDIPHVEVTTEQVDTVNQGWIRNLLNGWRRLIRGNDD